MVQKSQTTTWDVSNPVNNGINYQPQPVQDFAHQQYHTNITLETNSNVRHEKSWLPSPKKEKKTRISIFRISTCDYMCTLSLQKLCGTLEPKVWTPTVGWWQSWDPQRWGIAMCKCFSSPKRALRQWWFDDLWEFNMDGCWCKDLVFLLLLLLLLLLVVVVAVVVPFFGAYAI